MKSINSNPDEKCVTKPEYPYLGLRTIDKNPHVAMWLDFSTAIVVWTNSTLYDVGEDVGHFHEEEYSVFTGTITLSND